MQIYESDILFSAPYNAKRLLNDSVDRSLKGYRSFVAGSPVRGLGNILLARIESVAAFSFVALSGAFLAVGGIVVSPFFLIPTIGLNLISRVPGISSYDCMQKLTQDSSDAFYRVFRIYVIAIPVFFLFLSASGINTVLPGILKPQNGFFRSIHQLVEPLGPLLNVQVIDFKGRQVVGTWTQLSALAGVEEYFRALSSENYLNEIRSSFC